ncbi:hypothetical protein ACFE04_007601 [Oxalis oulophora]
MMCEFDTTTTTTTSSSTISISTPSTLPLVPSLQLQRADDICFKCKEKGHWSKDCPKKKDISNSNISNVPIVYCPCGSGPCKILVSTTHKHPGWKFYTCPSNPLDKGCKFFKWCKDVKAPMCRCNAGACSINTWREEDDGPDAGRLYFACRIQKGHGACPFFEWVDQGEGGSSTSFHSKDQGSGSRSSDSLQMTPDIVTDVLDSGIEQDFAMDEMQVHSPTIDDESFLEICNSLSCQVEQDVAMQDVVPVDPVPNNISSLMTQSEIHSELSRLISTIDVQQTLGLEVFGWWGRILFQPSRSLTEIHPKPFFCIPKSTPLHNYSSQEASSGMEAHRSNEVLDAFGKVLLVALKSLDSDAMSELADATFSALERLSIDHRTVSQPVSHFISCLSRVKELESLIRNSPSSEELMEQCEIKRNNFDEISGLHGEAIKALSLSYGQCQNHQEKVSRLRNKLKLIERQLAIYEAENTELENRITDICVQLLESKVNVERAEEAFKSRQQLEAELLAARAALEQTKNQLNAPLYE